MLKQFVKSILCLVVVTLAIPMMSRSVLAQTSPAISPWMQMLNRSREPGQLDNYNRLVKPQQDAMKAYANQQSQLQAQQQALRAMQSGADGSSGGGSGSRNLLTPGGSPSGGSSSAANNLLLSPPREIPSTQRNPAVYTQYLHYYPPQSMWRRPVPYYSPAAGGYSTTGGRR